jgi:hypothetical protein
MHTLQKSAPSEQAKMVIRHERLVEAIKTLKLKHVRSAAVRSMRTTLNKALRLEWRDCQTDVFISIFRWQSRHGMLKAVGQGGDASRNDTLHMGGGVALPMLECSTSNRRTQVTRACLFTSTLSFALTPGPWLSCGKVAGPLFCHIVLLEKGHFHDCCNGDFYSSCAFSYNKSTFKMVSLVCYCLGSFLLYPPACFVRYYSLNRCLNGHFFIVLLGTSPAGYVPNTSFLSPRLALQAVLACASRMVEKWLYRCFPYGSTQASKHALNDSRMTVGRFVVLLTGCPSLKGGVLMTTEEMRVLEREMLEVGQVAQSSQHPMYVAGVLIGLYRRAYLDIDRMALAYAFSLLVQSSKTCPGDK